MAVLSGSRRVRLCGAIKVERVVGGGYTWASQAGISPHPSIKAS
jgi:hypothetical protein